MLRSRFAMLLVMLMTYMLAAPVMQLVTGRTHPKATQVILTIVFVMLVLSAVRAVLHRGWKMLIAEGLAVIIILLHGITIYTERKEILVVSWVIDAIFLSFVIVLVLKSIFLAKRVTFDTICASVCIYLLFGVLWAVAYSLIEVLIPGSFALSVDETVGPEIMRMTAQYSFNALHYSFVTLTTLGYGDITPVSPLACMFSDIEAVVGQIYLAVLIARLIGIHVSHYRLENL